MVLTGIPVSWFLDKFNVSTCVHVSVRQHHMGEQELKGYNGAYHLKVCSEPSFTQKYIFTHECGHFSDLVVWQIDSFQAGNQVHWLRNCKIDKQ